MKIGIIYMDGTFSKSRKDNNLLGKEAIFLRDGLKKFKNTEAFILTTSVRDICADIYIDETYDINSFDKIILFFASINQWGGALNQSQYLCYKILSKYMKSIFYVFEDFNYPYSSLWNMIRNKPWFKNSNFYCTEEELTLQCPIIVLSMFKNFDTIKQKTKHPIKDIYYIPLQNTRFDDRKIIMPLFGKTVDLIYGGYNRKQTRNNFYQEYFFNRKNITTELYGKLKKDLKDVNIGKTVLSEFCIYDNVLSKNAEGLATIIPAEKYYNNNCITPRIIEALRSGLICFIENDFDVEHKIFKNDFFYVSSGDELEQKILEIKTNKVLYNELLLIQNKVLINMKNNDLCQNVYDILVEN